jgi:hypothetical protein
MALVIEPLKGENDSERNSYPLTVFPQRGPDWSIRLQCQFLFSQK